MLGKKWLFRNRYANLYSEEFDFFVCDKFEAFNGVQTLVSCTVLYILGPYESG